MQSSLIPEMSVQELKQALDANEDLIILDVRRQEEHDFCHINGALFPSAELLDRIHELDPLKKTVVHCRSGGRSKQCVELLLKRGFREVYNLQGGIIAWAKEIDSSVPTY